MRHKAELFKEGGVVVGILLEAVNSAQVRKIATTLRAFVGPFQLQPAEVALQERENVGLLLVFNRDAEDKARLPGAYEGTIAVQSLELVQYVVAQLEKLDNLIEEEASCRKV